MSKTHVLKVLDDYVDYIYTGLKTFEIRKNDRDFKEGDFIIFKVIQINKTNFLPETIEHPINYKRYQIMYILDNFPQGLKDEYIALAIKEVGNVI